MIHILARETLYERVWTEPLATLAKAFETNGPWLKKLCVEAGIPLPPMGHWSRLRAGKAVLHAPLPPRPPGARAVITIGEYDTWWRRRSELLKDPRPLKPDFSEPLADLAARLAATIDVAPEAAASARRNARPADRRGSLLDLLRMTLSKIGATLEGSDDPSLFSACACYTGVAFTLSLCSASMVLRLRAYDGQITEPFRAVFADEADRPLEHKVKEIAIALMVAADKRYRDKAEAHYAYCLERRAEAAEDARQRGAKAGRLLDQRRREREERRRQFLFAQADDWRTAKDIRGFVDEILSQARTDSSRPELAAWAQWALAEADAIDPVKQNDLLAYPGVRLGSGDADKGS
jgi:hypothetical protein